MKKLLALTSMLFALSAGATTATVPYAGSLPVYVNTASFSTLGTSAEVLDAMNAMLAQLGWGGTYPVLYTAQSSTLGACSAGPFAIQVFMSSTAHPSGLREVQTVCAGGGQKIIITLYPATGQTVAQSWSLNSILDTKRDVGMAVLKGMAMYLLHTGGCLIGASSNGDLLAMRNNWCQADVEGLGGINGHWRSSLQAVENTLGFPAVSTWSTLSLPVTLNTGFGGVNGNWWTQSSTNYKILTIADESVNPHTPLQYTNYSASTINSSITPFSGEAYLGRSSIAYDSTRGTWWIAVADTASGMLTTWWTADFITYTEVGFFIDFCLLSCGNYPCCSITPPNIFTNSAPAIAYDAASDSIVVAFTFNPTTSGPCGTGDGCNNEIHVTTHPAGDSPLHSAFTGFFYPDQRVTGSAGPSLSLGMMSIAPMGLYCSHPSVAPTASTPNCEVAAPVIARGATKAANNVLTIKSLPFRTNCSPTAPCGSPWNGLPASVQEEGVITSMGGETYLPLSLAGPSTGTARPTAAVRGTDGWLYLNSKTNTTSAWGGWFVPMLSGVNIATLQAPLIMSNDANSKYNLFFTTN